jgi:hypothetical protein
VNINKLLIGTVCAIAVMLASTAQANTIQWTLGGVTFIDGGALTGTFSTDSGTGDLLSYNLTSTKLVGGNYGGFHYNVSDSRLFSNNYYSGNSFLIAAGNYPNVLPYLNLAFQNGLTYIGTDALVTGYDAVTQGGSWECMSGANFCGLRAVSSGYAISSSSPVPEPQTYAMMLAGLGLIGFIAYRRKSDSSNMPMVA